MNKTEVRNIIEATLTSGTKIPGLFELPKVLTIKSKLESCASVAEALQIIQANRDTLSKSFGISEATFDAGIVQLKSLG